jgi:hypothetical protein
MQRYHPGYETIPYPPVLATWSFKVQDDTNINEIHKQVTSTASIIKREILKGQPIILCLLEIH